MLRFRYRWLGGVTVLVLGACTGVNHAPITLQTAECATQNWAGWAYVEGAGDFPFRVRAHEDGTGGLDLGAANLFDAPLTDVTYQDQALSFVWTSSSGDQRIFRGREQDLLVEGTIAWGDTTGTFVLNCAALPISARDSEASGVRSAFYLFPDKQDSSNDQIWFVDRAGYGETYARRLRDGRQRIVFPTTDNQYYLGRSLYDPSSVSSVFSMSPEGAIQIETSGLEGDQDAIAQPFALIRTEAIIDTPDGPLRVVITKRDLAPLNIAIILVPGSSWAVAEDEAFRTDNLAAYGFTLISFDKRGFGQSPGDEDRKFEATARDVGWVSDWAKDQNPQTLHWGVLATSRGGWIAPLIPNLNQRFDFAILSVSPAVSPYQQEFSARRAILRADGASSDLLAFADTYFDALLKFAKSGSEADREAYALLDAEAVIKLPDEMLGGEPNTPEDWHWWRLNGDYDPAQALSEIDIPTLVLLGAEDLRVPLEPTRTLMTTYRQQGAKPSLTVITLPGVGHDLALPFEGPIWALDSLGSESIEDVRQWVLKTTAQDKAN